MGKWIGWYATDQNSILQGTVAGTTYNNSCQDLVNNFTGWADGLSIPDNDYGIMAYVPNSTSTPVSVYIQNTGEPAKLQASFDVVDFIGGAPKPPNKPK